MKLIETLDNTEALFQYKRMFTQKMQHRAFIQKLEEYSSWNLDRSQDDVIQDIFKFLTDWLTKHIYELPMPFSLFLMVSLYL